MVSFATIVGQQVTLAPTASVAVGVYALELWVNLAYYPGVQTIKIGSFIKVTVIDC
jgi:hypothetical protein